MRKDNFISLKSIALLIACSFLLLAFGAGPLHTHSDFNYHDDCPICNWLIHASLVLVFILAFFGYLYVFSRRIFYCALLFISKFRIATLRLRAPPVSVSL